MGAQTNIPWCHHTWNLWRGCENVSPGCDNCFAEALSVRNPAVLGEWGPGANRVTGSDAYLKLPFKWNQAALAAGERRRVFCLSLGDWLEDREDLDVSRLIILNAIERTRGLDWLLLTKRPENFDRLLRRCLARVPGSVGAYDDALAFGSDWLCGRPPANVWALTSVEDQEYAGRRVPHLLKIPAVVHGISLEPMLGPVDLTGIRLPLAGESYERVNVLAHKDPLNKGRERVSVDWVICGAESGPGRRPFELDWARSVRDQCRAGGAAFFMKQDSGPRPGARGRIEDDLWLREFPTPNAHRIGA